MSFRTSILITLAMCILQSVVQYSDELPDAYKHLSLIAQVLLEALKSFRTHYFNTDGTHQSVGLTPPERGEKGRYNTHDYHDRHM